MKLNLAQCYLFACKFLETHSKLRNFETRKIQAWKRKRTTKFVFNSLWWNEFLNLKDLILFR